MRKILLIITMMTALLCQAQNATTIFNKTVSTYQKSGAVSASYTMGSSTGTIVMKDSQFRVLANNLKAWYDGKTQWTYTTATGEVNVTTPTAKELVMINPLSVASALKTDYTMTAKKSGASYVLTLKPKKKSNVKSIALYISSKYVLEKAVYTTKSGTETLKVSNYKTHVATSSSTFKFAKSMVPRGTEVVDLR